MAGLVGRRLAIDRLGSPTHLGPLAAPRNPGSAYDGTGLEYEVVTFVPSEYRPESGARNRAAHPSNAPSNAEQMA